MSSLLEWARKHKGRPTVTTPISTARSFITKRMIVLDMRKVGLTPILIGLLEDEVKSAREGKYRLPLDSNKMAIITTNHRCSIYYASILEEKITKGELTPPFIATLLIDVSGNVVSLENIKMIKEEEVMDWLKEYLVPVNVFIAEDRITIEVTTSNNPGVMTYQRYFIYQPFTCRLNKVVEEIRPREVGGVKHIQGYALIFIDSREAVISKRYNFLRGASGGVATAPYVPFMRATTFYLLPEEEKEGTGEEEVVEEIEAPPEEVEEEEVAEMAEKVEKEVEKSEIEKDLEEIRKKRREIQEMIEKLKQG